LYSSKSQRAAPVHEAAIFSWLKLLYLQINYLDRDKVSTVISFLG
jgi:hypothetical protein